MRGSVKDSIPPLAGAAATGVFTLHAPCIPRPPYLCPRPISFPLPHPQEKTGVLGCHLQLRSLVDGLLREADCSGRLAGSAHLQGRPSALLMPRIPTR